MDIIEEATVKFSSLEAKIYDEITDFKKEVLKEIKKMGTKLTNHNADQDSFRQQLHEKDLIIQDLRGLVHCISGLFHPFMIDFSK
jgi:hypothetical protein